MSVEHFFSNKRLTTQLYPIRYQAYSAYSKNATYISKIAQRLIAEAQGSLLDIE